MPQFQHDSAKIIVDIINLEEILEDDVKRIPNPCKLQRWSSLQKMVIWKGDLWNRGLILHHEWNVKTAERLKRYLSIHIACGPQDLLVIFFPMIWGSILHLLDTAISDHEGSEGRALFHSFLWPHESHPIPLCMGSQHDPPLKPTEDREPAKVDRQLTNIWQTCLRNLVEREWGDRWVWVKAQDAQFWSNICNNG